MPAFHSVYGLRLQCNRPVPGLEPLPQSEPVDAQIWLGDDTPNPAEAFRPHLQVLYVSPYYVNPGKPILTVSTLAGGNYFEFQYDDDTQFVVDREGTRIWATWADNSTVEDTATYLLGPVLGFVLRRRGIVCLHASAVLIDDQGVALAGPPGAGKSTMAAAFAKLGYPVLSDDVVALHEQDDRFFVQPGYPRLCLRPDATGLLYGSVDALPGITPNWDKRYLDLNHNGQGFKSSPTPLAVVYLLGNRCADTGFPRIEAVPARAGLIDLVANTHVNYLLDPQQRAQEFQLLGRLASRVPVRELTPDAEASQLKRVCDALLQDFHATTLRAAM